MKKINLFLALVILWTIVFPVLLNAQCTSGFQYQSYTPICTGNAETICTDGYAGEYDAVNLTAGVWYRFDSSNQTDIITITDNAGVVKTWGIATAMFKPTVGGVYRFYTHLANCGSDVNFRYRWISCGFTPLPCTTAVYNQYPAGVFTPACVSTDQVITTAGFASEYSLVFLKAGQIVTFKSSVASDVLTITDATGTIVYGCFTGQLTLTIPINANYRFYLHTAGCGSNLTTRSRIIKLPAPVTPGISIVAGNTTACAGATVTFTANVTNGGPSPSYQWKVNGNNVGTNQNFLIINTLQQGDVVSCVLTPNNACQTAATVTSNSITMTIQPTFNPAVGITTAQGTSCQGSTVSFQANPVNGGPSPSYQWKVNGVNVGTNSPNFSSSTLATGSVVQCVMTANNTCQTGSFFTSNSITVTVLPYVTPSVFIFSANNAACDGPQLFFRASATDCGPSPVYQWKKNGVNIGLNDSIFSSIALVNGDVIRCDLTANNQCQTTSQASTSSITIGSYVQTLQSTGSCTGDTITISNVGTFSDDIYRIWYKDGNVIDTVWPSRYGADQYGASVINNVAGLAFDAINAMYVIDRNAHKVYRFTKNVYTIVTFLGSIVGHSDSTFNQPVDIQFDMTGNAYVLDKMNNRVMRFAPGSKKGITVAGGNGYGASLNQLGRPQGFWVQPDGTIYIADQENHRVVKWLRGATVGILVAGGNGAGNAPNQLNNPYDVTVDGFGNVFVSDPLNSRVQQWVPGALTGTTIAGNGVAGNGLNQLNDPKGITVDKAGNIFVADYGNSRTIRWKPGESVGKVLEDTQLPPIQLAFNSVGDLCETEGFFHSAQMRYYRMWRNYHVPQSPGVYSVVRYDSKGCEIFSQSVTIQQESPALVTLTLNRLNNCEGTPGQFVATPDFGGTSPVYTWRKNGVVVQNGGSTYSPSVLNNGDLINCTLVSNYVCSTNNTDTAAIGPITVLPTTNPSVSIVQTTTGYTCPGDLISFTANPIDATSFDTVRWYVNSIYTGISGNSFSSTTLAQGDIVKAYLEVNYTCSSLNGFNSNNITIFHFGNCNPPMQVSMKMFLEGLYAGNQQMIPQLYQNGLSTDPMAVDSVTVEFHNSAAPYTILFTTDAILKTNGLIQIFPPSQFIGQTVYLVVKPRNGIETWSKNPVLLQSSTMFDFTQ
ncbi:MAG: hypothetical protein KBB64_09335 [Bacteroidia bacterium]|nr:hypothetical protein [Bacteroidia bacterium]